MEVDQYIAADRFSRFAASLIDAVVVALASYFILVPFEILYGDEFGFDYETMNGFLLGIVCYIWFLILNIRLMNKSGQTIGKRLMYTKVVDLEGRVPSIKNQQLARYAMVVCLPYFGAIGLLLLCVNILTMFRQQRLCGHDYIFKTKVVKANKKLKLTPGGAV